MELRKLIQNDFNNLDLFQFVNNVNERTRFTLSYIALLMASTTLSTLGLLIESVPVLIGGMIISPLMWPMIKIALGVTYERIEYIRQALILLFASIVISIASGILITFISPLQFLNNTIISLANPTLLDLIIALVAGAVASFSLIQPKINDSLAGVAIATSLMPPLCNVGISLALGRSDLSINSLTLFGVHVISIIFIAIVIFGAAGLRTKSRTGIIKQRTMILLTLILTTLSFPLFVYMRDYALSSSAIVVVQEVLEEDLGKISNDFSVNDINTELKRDGGSEILAVNTTISLPEDVILDFELQQDIVRKLQSRIERDVDLTMAVTRTISVVTDSDKEVQRKRDEITKFVESFVESFSTEFASIESLTIDHNPNEEIVWAVDLKISADPSLQLTENQRGNLESELEFIVSENTQMDITIFPRINLISQDVSDSQTQYSSIRNNVTTTVQAINWNIQTESVSVETFNEEKDVQITVDLVVPNFVSIDTVDVQTIAKSLAKEFDESDQTVRLIVNIVDSRTFNTSVVQPEEDSVETIILGDN